MATLPFASMRINALGANETVDAAMALPKRAGTLNANRRPPPVARLACRKSLRDVSKTLGDISGSLSIATRILCRLLDCHSDPRIRATTTDVPGHGAVDVGIAWARIGGEQGGRRHDLA